jgi:hypothetical protein
MTVECLVVSLPMPSPFLLAIPPFFTRAQVENVGYGLHIFVSC